MRRMSHLGIEQIFATYDNPKGNAETERVIRTLKEELMWLNEFTSFSQIHNALTHWIDTDYNKHYVYSAIGYMSPNVFEKQFWKETEAAS